jgi:hypothetical protein
MVTGVPQEERAQIDAVQRRLAQKYAEMPHDRVVAGVQQAYARFSQSTLRDFVPLLVERRAREELARSTARDAVAKAGRAAAGSEIADVRHMRAPNGARPQAPPRWRWALGVSQG